MAEPAISVEGVSRWFGTGKRRVDALRDLSFHVAEGEVVALLGSNGAGKTTVTKILSTLLLPSTGTARLFGHDVARETRACRKLASVVFGGERGLYSQLSGLANLRFFGMLAGVGRRTLDARVRELLEQVGLTDVADRRVETYSKGMKQRLHIAIGFMPRPRVLLLDEPTVGLDPVEADRLRAAVQGAHANGVSVLLTSHYLLDVERLADRVLLLDRGHIAEDLSLDDFARRAGYAAAVTVRGTGPAPHLPATPPEGISLVGSPATVEGQWQLTLRMVQWSPNVFGHLATLLSGLDVTDVQVRQVRLEDAFTMMAGERP